jgi:hypothetical protein
MNLQLINKVNDLIQASGCEVNIVGGAVRDSLMRIKTPKDFDVAVPRAQAAQFLSYLFERGFWVRDERSFWVRDEALSGASCDESNDVPENKFSQLWSGWHAVKGNVGGVAVVLDVLELHTGSSVRQVVEGFDFNINQCAMRRDGSIWYTGCSLGTLVQLKDVQPERLEHIRRIADHIGWLDGTASFRVVEES